MPKATISDPRPSVAIGHVEHHVVDVAKSATFLESIGIRPIVRHRNFAVMELRGGTHIILAKAKDGIEKGTPAPFDKQRLFDLLTGKLSCRVKAANAPRLRGRRAHCARSGTVRCIATDSVPRASQCAQLEFYGTSASRRLTGADG